MQHFHPANWPCFVIGRNSSQFGVCELSPEVQRGAELK